MFTNLINRAADEDRVLFNLIGCPAILAAGFFLGTESASAHIMDGKTPSTFAEGLLSGVGHPIIGADYLAFLLALGIAQITGSWLPTENLPGISVAIFFIDR